MELETVQDARKEGLIQLTVWLFQQELGWLIKERNRIRQNKDRKTMLVKDGNKYALFVDNIAKAPIELDLIED